MPIITQSLVSSSTAVVVSALRIGLAIFSLPVLLGFGVIDTHSNPYAPCSGATYLEACFQISFSYSHRLFVLPGHCRGNSLFGSMGVTVAPLLKGW